MGILALLLIYFFYLPIDEIKTTTKDLLLIDENTNPLHWAQAKCYGYIYSMQNELVSLNPFFSLKI